ncbi:sugar phosphate isomerase/epimerase [Frondihabitans sp. PhB188]|uniref:sugar phosphate isomerase/epimerase family protein n=1 Tax=Frondihabitans sp. PhB188 TaxID=2485200 RepID=UPI000F48FD5F|nr:sugar phosphate isomerase/epimerase family protein [Frondihabitans sp. PhB188]ROQ38745.1 sugar phosphate isomerase/epimerase [Frondihabitans sp. PhB188]
MPLTAETWPIAAMLLQFPNQKRDGTTVQDDPPEAWREVFDEVRAAGFTAVDLTDGWLRVGDLSAEQLDALKHEAASAGLATPAISLVRRSVIDAENWQDNLAFTHRTIDAAAALGVGTVSIGLHQALTDAQKQQLWFWTVDGHKDPDDADTWRKAVTRIQELADHAADLKIELSLEMYEDTYLGTADSAVRLKTDIDRPNCGLNPDLGNLVRLHRPIEDWREALKKTLPHSNYWHVKNYYRDEDRANEIYVASPAPMEFGIISYREAIKIALASGYTGAFCCEHYGGDGLSVSATNEKYLRGLLKALKKENR